ESALVSFFMDAGIQNVVFRKGVARPELLAFLDGLVQRFWDLKDAKVINERLRKEGVTSMGVDDDGELEPVALESGAKEAADGVPGLLSLEKGREAIVELARVYRSAGDDLKPGLRNVAAILLESYRHDARLTAALRRVVTAEAPSLMPGWM